MGYFTDTDFEDTCDMIDCINEVVERNIRSNFEQTSAVKLGLDIRAGYRIFVNRDYIATSNRRELDYYGGFEYVDRDSVTVIGDYTFYDSNDERVSDCIEAFYESMDNEMEAGLDR